LLFNEMETITLLNELIVERVKKNE
jgi:hypothetical protein